MMLPLVIFGLVFIGALVALDRRSATVSRLVQHEVGIRSSRGGTALGERVSILGQLDSSSVIGQIVAKLTRPSTREKAEKLLNHAGRPMPLGTFLTMRVFFMFALTPLLLLYIYQDQGPSVRTFVIMGFLGFITPNAPESYLKRKARKREREVERAMPDALDLLVVCVESGMSLDGGMQQVSQRTDGLLASELSRMLSEISTGMTRREALLGLGSRTSSVSLGALVTTIIQADKMGVSIAATLRTLAETLRTTRRQGAETQARKAPIKMMPFIVFFMLPALFAVILGPVVISLMELN